MPLLPNKVGKRSETMTMVTTSSFKCETVTSMGVSTGESTGELDTGFQKCLGAF